METIEKIVYRLIFAKDFAELVVYDIEKDVYVELHRASIDFYNAVGDLIDNYYWYKQHPNSFKKEYMNTKIPMHPFYELCLNVESSLILDEKIINPFYNGMFSDFREKMEPVIKLLDKIEKTKEKNKQVEIEKCIKIYEDFKRDLGVNYILNRYDVDKITRYIDISSLSENLNLNTTPSYDNLYLYCYDCEDLMSLIFATIHNYLDRGYKIRKCKHCERYFVPFTHNDQYCKRNSPYKFNNCDSKQCEEAVRYIFKILDRRFNSIRSNFYDQSNGGYYKPEHNKFFQKAEELNKMMRKIPIMQNILKYEEYLNSPKLPKWRRKINECSYIC